MRISADDASESDQPRPVHGRPGALTSERATRALQEGPQAGLHALDARMQRILRVTEVIADAVTPEQVYAAVVDRVATILDAFSASLWLLSDDERRLRPARMWGYSARAQQVLEAWSEQAQGALPVLDALRARTPLWYRSPEELLAVYPHLASMVTPGRAYRTACIPMVVNERALGSLAFTFETESDDEHQEQELLLLVTRYSAQALARLSLLASERKTLAVVEAAAARLAVLNRAARAFSEAGTDLSALLDAIIKQVMVEYADGCGVALLSEEEPDTLELAGLHHKSKGAVELLRALLTRRPLKLGEGLSGRVAASGKGLLIPCVELESLLRSVQPEHRPWFELDTLRSLIIVPLRARSKLIGTITAMRGADAPPFCEDDLQLLEELGERAALAVENVRLYRENQRARASAELLYQLAGSVIRAPRVEEVFRAALDGIEGALGTQRCAILAFDPDGVMRFKAARGLSDAYQRAVEGHSPWPRGAHAPEPVLVPDVTRDATLAGFLPLFETEQVAALGFIPLVAGGLLLGKFMVYYREPHAFSAAELALAKAIANHVAIGLSRFAAFEELQQTVRFNEMFTGILGHDLRNPLASIVMGAQLALTHAQSETVTKPLARVVSSAGRMGRMIDQLLDFTRVRVGSGIAVTPAPTDLLPLLRQVIGELQDSHPARAVRLEVADGDSSGRWDADRLAQVFSNLVANALQHSDPRHPVLVRLEPGGAASVELTVHNAGGIEPELLARMFEPMAGGPRRREQAQGLGLGLYITREIVKAHGGSIDVRSSAADGTHFVVTLPRSTQPAER